MEQICVPSFFGTLGVPGRRHVRGAAGARSGGLPQEEDVRWEVPQEVGMLHSVDNMGHPATTAHKVLAAAAALGSVH